MSLRMSALGSEADLAARTAQRLLWTTSRQPAVVAGGVRIRGRAETLNNRWPAGRLQGFRFLPSFDRHPVTRHIKKAVALNDQNAIVDLATDGRATVDANDLRQ